MNKFDKIFFSKYLSEWTEILNIIHKHIVVVLNKIILNYFFWVILPSFLYYYSNTIKLYIPFFLLEIFLIWMFIKWLFDIFDRYNDVWILTEDWVVDLDWKLFSSDSVSVKYESIEWLEIVEKWFLDKLLGKADIIIHKIWWWNQFILEDAVSAYKNVEIIDKKLKILKKETEEKSKEFSEQNFETVLKALTKVVEWYLEDNWYKKDDREEKKALIREIKRKWWVIDLTK
jgi:hypothetical protein